MSTVIRWEDPPRANVSWKAVAEELRTRPGQWARVHEPTNLSRANDVCTHLKKWGCEAVARKVDTEGTGVWARYPLVENPHVATDPQARREPIDA